MNASGRITMAAWAATVAAATALLPVVDGTDWLVQAALLLGLVSGVGVLCRWRRLPRPLAQAAQLAAAVLLITLATVPEVAVAGLLPGPDALEELGRLFTAGVQDVGHYQAPAPLTDGIRLLLVTGVLAIGLLVDQFATDMRSAAAAGLPLLALYSIAAGVTEDGAQWQYFLIASAGFLALLLAEGRSRVPGWGRFFPGPRSRPPGAGAGRPPGPRLRTGRRIAAAALGTAVLVPALLPSLSTGVFDLRDAGPSGSGTGPGGNLSVNPVVALQDQLNQPQNRTVLTYRTDGTEPQEMYLRLISLDAFDGETWTSSDNLLDEIPESPWPVAGLSPDVAATVVNTEIVAEPDYTQRSLPVPSPATAIAASGDWAYDAYSRTLRADRREQSSAGLTYHVRHLRVEPTAAQLARAPEPESEVIREHFTALPEDLPPIVRERALEVTAGAAGDYEQALALQRWFTREGDFRYSTRVESGTGTEAVADFLQAREGFCIHFAFAMGAMARSLDIPARVSVGFTPGTLQADGSFRVGAHNAHAWPELYFEGVGWTRFEPTPGQGSAPEYTRRVPDATDERPEPEQTPTAEPEQPEPDDQAGPVDCDPMLEPGACDAAEDGGAALADERSALLWPALWGGGGVLLVMAALGAPVIWRARMRARRLARDAGPLDAWEELTDTAWDLGVIPHHAETPRRTAGRLVENAGLDGAAAGAVHRVATAVEHELYAPPTAGAGPGNAADDVRAAIPALYAAFPRTVRLRARLLPRSAARVAYRLGAARARAARAVARAGDRLRRRRPTLPAD